MLKRELIAALSKRHKDLKVKDVDLMARLVFETMAEALIKNRGIELRGFGSFHLRRYSPRSAHNPGSGRKVWLGVRRGVLFRAARSLKNRLNDQ